MCQYCEKPNKTIVTHISGVSAFVGAGRLFLRFNDDECKKTIINAEFIKYCPMCGRNWRRIKKCKRSTKEPSRFARP